MNENIQLLIGILVLVLGIPFGRLLAWGAKEELKDGQKWFRRIIILGLIGGIFGLILGNDVILFSFLFIAIVTSQSLKINLKKTH